MRKPIKKTLRETMLANQQAMDELAKITGKPQVSLGYVKPKREVVNHSDKNELEAAVLREVGQLLAIHPQVAFAVRQNSGAAWMRGAGGKDMPVSFYKMVRVPEPMVVTDYWGIMRDGRLLAIECKRRSWTKPTDERERNQAAFLNMVNDFGGIGIFATCAENVEAVFSQN